MSKRRSSPDPVLGDPPPHLLSGACLLHKSQGPRGLSALALLCFGRAASSRALSSTDADRLLSPADRRHIPAAAPLGAFSGPAGLSCWCGALTSERKVENARCVVLFVLLFMGTRPAVTALPCGSFLLVVEELCPGRGGLSWSPPCWTVVNREQWGVPV